MAKPVLFKDIKLDAAFTPFNSVGAGQVFVKKENGICPVIDRENKRQQNEHDRFVSEGIFYPDDRVWAVNVPSAILKRYQFRRYE